ncbi:hypothetical protein J7J18_04415 [bacterium]|nr:hypothetical protein [bacterium]
MNVSNVTYYWPTNVTSLGDWFNYANFVSGHILGYGIIGAVFLISYISFSQYNQAEAIGGASFLAMLTTFILGLFMSVNPSIAVIFLLLFFASIFMKKRD